ncbi:TetR/AcrR family transcriptional regulator [Mycobacterium sp. M1]|uniref:TetR/AcrR family transcriptional regulator n=1 Tax=Mycolicibacter acidiphilus TaxID=2835306 RepID=A0ABS5RJY0_9MYCO|nr:TetR/AcrR family transcriptional regulator [Mycolicibacter acidiphilus]MBS9534586.1 TetR/AcrR family transcriptional regulator [Mycolicibacter acidiphilus]
MPEPNLTADRTARRAAANREAIIDAAEELLEAGGLGAVTVEAVAERADVAIQTVYNRVGRRPEVLVAVAERAVAENRRYLEPAFAAPGTPRQRLAGVARAYIAFAWERPRQFELLNTPPDEPDALASIAAKIDEQVGRLAEILAAGVADGTFDPTLEPPVAATALWAMLEGVLSLGWRADRKDVAPVELRAMVDFAAATMIDGISTRPSQPDDEEIHP